MTQPREEAVALKLLHTADWHLGKRFTGFESANDRARLARARLDVVESILSVAEHEAVDAVLVAGDVFDTPNPGRDWWEGLARKLAQRAWQDRPVFLLPGNHDPLSPGSVYSNSHHFRAALPDWVHVVDRDAFSFELNDDAVLYACPCGSQAGQIDPTLRLPERQPGDQRIRIGMVHGQTFDIPGHQMNFPIARDAALRRGLDYLAIGDTHAFRIVPGSEPVPTVYPGTPEQTTFGETDTGNVAVVFFRRRGRRPIVRPQRVARWTWRTETCRDLARLCALRDTEDLRQTVLRLVIDMRATPQEYDEIEQILRELGGTEASLGRAGVLQVMRDGLSLDTRGIGQVFDDLPEVVQAAVRLLTDREARGDQTEVARQALVHLYRLSRAWTTP